MLAHEGRVQWTRISDVQKCQVIWGRKDGKMFDFDINQFLYSFSVPPTPS